MSMADLRSHVADQRVARKGQSTNVRPPAGAAVVESVELSAMDLQICKETGCDPKEYVRLKRIRDGVETSKDGN
jgi:hypothetical protein